MMAGKSGASFAETNQPAEAVKDADVVYTDVWTSMGQEAESEQRTKDFAGFQINAELMKMAQPTAVVMHCLPAHRGDEITSDVLDGSQSIVFQQAENRLHSQRAPARSPVHQPRPRRRNEPSAAAGCEWLIADRDSTEFAEV